MEQSTDAVGTWGDGCGVKAVGKGRNYCDGRETGGDPDPATSSPLAVPPSILPSDCVGWMDGWIGAGQYCPHWALQVRCAGA